MPDAAIDLLQLISNESFKLRPKVINMRENHLGAWSSAKMATLLQIVKKINCLFLFGYDFSTLEYDTALQTMSDADQRTIADLVHINGMKYGPRVKQEAKLLFLEGFSYKGISKVLGTSKGTLYKWKREAGLVNSDTQKTYSEETKQKTLSLLNSGVPYAVIKADLGPSKSTVANWKRQIRLSEEINFMNYNSKMVWLIVFWQQNKWNTDGNFYNRAPVKLWSRLARQNPGTRYKIVQLKEKDAIMSREIGFDNIWELQETEHPRYPRYDYLRAIHSSHPLISRYKAVRKLILSSIEHQNNCALTLVLYGNATIGFYPTVMIVCSNPKTIRPMAFIPDEFILHVERGGFRRMGLDMGASIGASESNEKGTLGGYLMSSKGAKFALTCGHVVPESDKVAHPSKSALDSKRTELKGYEETLRVMIKEGASESKQESYRNAIHDMKRQLERSIFGHVVQKELMIIDELSIFGHVVQKELMIIDNSWCDWALIKPALHTDIGENSITVYDTKKVCAGFRDLKADQRVVKHGAKTGVTFGTVGGIKSDVILQNQRTSEWYVVSDEDSQFADEGDSGAWVMQWESGKLEYTLLGMIHGGAYAKDDRKTHIVYVSPINNVLSRIERVIGRVTIA